MEDVADTDKNVIWGSWGKSESGLELLWRINKLFGVTEKTQKVILNCYIKSQSGLELLWRIN